MLEARADRFLNNLFYDTRTQLIANPKRVRLNVSIPCSKDIFFLVFGNCPELKEKTTPKLGYKIFLKLKPPNTTQSLLNIIGKSYGPSLRRFHGKDGAGTWSTTTIDPDSDIEFKWYTLKRKNKTPLGMRLDEKEVVSFSFSVTTAPITNDNIKPAMKQEESAKPRFHVVTDLHTGVSFFRELASRRSMALREKEREIEVLQKRVKRLKRDLKSWTNPKIRK